MKRTASAAQAEGDPPAKRAKAEESPATPAPRRRSQSPPPIKRETWPTSYGEFLQDGRPRVVPTKVVTTNVTGEFFEEGTLVCEDPGPWLAPPNGIPLRKHTCPPNPSHAVYEVTKWASLGRSLHLKQQRLADGNFDPPSGAACPPLDRI